MGYKRNYFREIDHQKTALSDGFNASVGSKPTLFPQAKVNTLYHKIDSLSNIEKNTSVDRTGFEPAPFA